MKGLLQLWGCPLQQPWVHLTALAFRNSMKIFIKVASPDWEEAKGAKICNALAILHLSFVGICSSLLNISAPYLVFIFYIKQDI